MNWALLRCPICGRPMLMVRLSGKFWRSHKPHALRTTLEGASHE